MAVRTRNQCKKMTPPLSAPQPDVELMCDALIALGRGMDALIPLVESDPRLQSIMCAFGTAEIKLVLALPDVEQQR